MQWLQQETVTSDQKLLVDRLLDNMHVDSDNRRQVELVCAAWACLSKHGSEFSASINEMSFCCLFKKRSFEIQNFSSHCMNDQQFVAEQDH